MLFHTSPYFIFSFFLSSSSLFRTILAGGSIHFAPQFLLQIIIFSFSLNFFLKACSSRIFPKIYFRKQNCKKFCSKFFALKIVHKSPGKKFLGNFFFKNSKKKIFWIFSQKMFEKNRSDFFRPAAAEISGKKLGEKVGQKIRHKKSPGKKFS